MAYVYARVLIFGVFIRQPHYKFWRFWQFFGVGLYYAKTPTNASPAWVMF